MVKKELLVILLLLLFTYPAIRSLFIPGGFTSHDLTHHIVRQISMDKLLSEGQFPPRWSGELNNGFGYPLFLFNYPLPAMVGEIFHKLGAGFVDSVKAVLFTSMVLSVIGMYLFLNALLKDRLAAFLGAVFYLYAPLRFLNVYVSAAVGSALALGILPFVFWALVKVRDQGDQGGRDNWGAWGGLFLALLILAHNVTALIFAPALLVFSWLLVRNVREVSPSTSSLRVKEIGVMILLGLGLSAWFWLPAIAEKQYIIFDAVFGDFYQDQFPSFWQLLRSPWGYGLSHPQSPEPGDMSYQLGLIHLLAIVVYGVWFLVYGRQKKDRLLGIFALAAFFISVFLMLKISLPLWESVPFLSWVQFPLRFSAVAVFSASLAAALAVKWIRFWRVRGKWSIFVILLVLVIYANRNHWRINQVYDPGEDYYLSLKTTSASFNEHLPKWAKAMDKKAAAKLEFVEGGGRVQIIKDYSGLVYGQVEASVSSKLRLNQFYFPGWEVRLNNQKVDVDYTLDGESYGLIVFDITPGKYQVLAGFKNTPIRNLADFISISSLGLWLVLSFRGVPRSGTT